MTLDESIKKDVLDMYKSLMEEQEKLKVNSLAAGGNVGVIIAAYINAKYNKTDSKHKLY